MRGLRNFLHLPLDVWQLFVTNLPGPFGHWLRFRYWRKRLKGLGRGTLIDVGVHIQGAERVTIGENAWIDRHVLILAGAPQGERTILHKENPAFTHGPGEVVIGDRTHIAPNCVLSGIGGIAIGSDSGVASGSCIYSFSHHYRNLADPEDKAQYSFTPMARSDQQALVSSPVVLKDHSAVGLHSVLLPGTTLGRGAWVASGVVVSRSVPDQTLAYLESQPRTKSLSELEIKT